LTTADAPWLFIALIVRMATTLLKGEESTRDNHLLAGNFATDFEFFLLTDSTINLFKFDY